MKEQSVSRGFAVLSAAGIIVKVLSFLYIPFLKGIIDDSGYGIYAAAYSVYVFIYVLTNAGVPVAISKLVSELAAVKNYKDAVRSFKIARFLLLVAGTVMTLIMMFASGPLANFINFPEARLAILALSPTLLFTAVASSYRGYFQGRGNMVPTAVSQIIEQVINTVFTVLFAYILYNYGKPYGKEIEYACAGGTIGTSLGALIAAIYLVISYRSNHKFISVKNDISEPVKRYNYEALLKKIIHYSVPITLSVGMTYAGNLIDTWNTKTRLTTAGFNNDSANALYGQLSLYTQLMNVPIAVITSLAAAILPAISGALAAKNHALVHDRINYAFRICLMIAVPSAAGLSVLSRPIYDFIKLGDGYPIMMYGAFVLVLMSLVQIQNSVLQSCGKLYNVAVNLLIGIIAKIITNYFLIAIPGINVYGAIIGSAIGYFIPIILNIILINKFLKIKLNPAFMAFKPAVASVAMSLAAGFGFIVINKLLSLLTGPGYFSNAIAVVMAIAAGALTYFYTLFISGGITSDDLNIIPSKLRRFLPDIRKKLADN